MKFQPKSEEDLKRENLCKPGMYPFTVLAAADKTSKKLREDGSPKEMIALKLNVHADDGFDYHIYDWVSADFMAHKLRHFAYAVGLGPKYEAGTLTAEDCAEREGWCHVETQEDKTGVYGPKNTIKDYAPQKEKDEPAKAAKKAAKPAEKPEAEDDVPF